jgi:hypothetical protein
MSNLLRSVAVGGVLAVGLSGCASIIEGTTQSIAITTPPADGAKCVLTSSEGTYYVTTPGNVTVHKAKNDLAAECNKDGFQTAKATIPAHFNGATAGNVIAGGIIGIGIDAATGANFNYPATFAIAMTPVSTSSATPPANSAPAMAASVKPSN